MTALQNLNITIIDWRIFAFNICWSQQLSSELSLLNTRVALAAIERLFII